MRPKLLKQVDWLDEVPALLWRAYKKKNCAAPLLALSVALVAVLPTLARAADTVGDCRIGSQRCYVAETPGPGASGVFSPEDLPMVLGPTSLPLHPIPRQCDHSGRPYFFGREAGGTSRSLDSRQPTNHSVRRYAQ